MIHARVPGWIHCFKTRYRTVASSGFACAHARFKRLHIRFQSGHTIEHALDSRSHRAEQIGRVGHAERVALEVLRTHRARSRQQPRAGYAQRDAQRLQELCAWRLPVHVSADGLGVCPGQLRQMTVRPAASSCDESFMELRRIHANMVPRNRALYGHCQPCRTPNTEFSTLIFVCRHEFVAECNGVGTELQGEIQKLRNQAAGSLCRHIPHPTTSVYCVPCHEQPSTALAQLFVSRDNIYGTSPKPFSHGGAFSSDSLAQWSGLHFGGGARLC